MNVNDTNRQNHVPVSNQRPEGSKCHGNRKDQRFGKKCRARGLKAARIEKLLDRRKQIRNKKNPTKNTLRNTNHLTAKGPVSSDASHLTMMMPNLNKRKRDLFVAQSNINPTKIGKSTSSMALTQPSLKKKKKILVDPSIFETTNNIMNTNYRFVIILMD